MWRGNEDVLVTDLDDELVLMHAGRSEMFSLNAAGRLLWQALPASEETLTELLRRTFDLNGAQAQLDVRAVLQDLAARDLIRPE
ncbi:PqqD family protein [Deinococcus sp. 23YEL01]|uniref:PqqD family protein n=1 Tax=Deinococcus sp. 23YEL01 TaxID=2745871 RepID=UPI001E2DA65C|nr:PqqD family protein [Deinococcus sp. 23YEL01]MCD0170855.1 PqqD family protein [Deinococcus sp. 23YEL01]